MLGSLLGLSLSLSLRTNQKSLRTKTAGPMLMHSLKKGELIRTETAITKIEMILRTEARVRTNVDI